MRLLPFFLAATVLIAATLFAAEPPLRIHAAGDLIVRGTHTHHVQFRTGVKGSLVAEVPRSTQLLQLSSVSGNIDVSDIEGSVRAEVSGGRVIADRIAGNLEIRSGGGTIRASQIRGEGVFETGGGDIEISQIFGMLQALTGGGSIRIDGAGGAVIARNLGGSIRLNNVAGRLLASTVAGSIQADILAGTPFGNSILSTENGDISVRVPSKVSVTVEAECEGSRRARDIASDFAGLRILERNGLVFANGNINGGGPVLRLASGGGRIEIKKK